MAWCRAKNRKRSDDFRVTEASSNPQESPQFELILSMMMRPYIQRVTSIWIHPFYEVPVLNRVTMNLEPFLADFGQEARAQPGLVTTQSQGA